MWLVLKTISRLKQAIRGFESHSFLKYGCITAVVCKTTLFTNCRTGLAVEWFESTCIHNYGKLIYPAINVVLKTIGTFVVWRSTLQFSAFKIYGVNVVPVSIPFCENGGQGSIPVDTQILYGVLSIKVMCMTVNHEKSDRYRYYTHNGE